jgi:hypothetical protein
MGSDCSEDSRKTGGFYVLKYCFLTFFLVVVRGGGRRANDAKLSLRKPQR